MKTYNIEIVVDDINNSDITDIKSYIWDILNSNSNLDIKKVSVIGMRYIHNNEEQSQVEMEY